MGAIDQGYGRAGRVAVLVPQENPTAEPEMSVLLAPDVAMMAMRMTSSSASMQARLCDYGVQIDRWMAAFGGAEFDAIVFACTGTSYVEAPEASLPTAWSSPSGRTTPFLSAAVSVGAALESLAAGSLALVSPYPAALQAAAVGYWRKRGFEVRAVETLAPPASGHVIYQQTQAAMSEAVARAQGAGADAIVILGTGAPTLAAIGGPSPERPILSSALCLGWAAEGVLSGAQQQPFAAWLAREAPWRARLGQRFPMVAGGQAAA